MNRSFWRGILLVAVLGLIVFAVSTFEASERGDELRVWFLDVGQGDAILIDTPESQQILIDGGPNSAVLQELSKALPLTDKEIDLVISTHNDADHLAGLNEVLRHYKINKIWLTGAKHTTQTYQTFVRLVEEKQIPTETVMAGATVKLGLLEGIAISPLENADGTTPDQQNEVGIVTFWQYGNETFLLTADIAEAQELALLNRGVVKPAEILKVAHHGSKNSSNENFIKTVSPKIAVISVGKNNRYGHPSPIILERLRLLAIPVLQTAELGTIRFDLFPTHYTYKTRL